MLTFFIYYIQHCAQSRNSYTFWNLIWMSSSICKKL